MEQLFVLIQQSLAMQYAPCPGIASRCDLYTQFKPPADPFSLLPLQAAERIIVKPPAPDQICDRHKCRHPDCPTLCQCLQACFVHKISVFHRIYPGFHCILYRHGTVYMCHHRKSFLMGNVDHFPDLLLQKGRLCHRSAV